MGTFNRKYNTRYPNKIIRIYTEGACTEPNYFNAIKNELRLNEINIQIHGMGDHTLPLIDRVVSDKNEDNEDSEWWVVYDRDDHDDFDNSIAKAEKNGIKVAYSNECFELWFLLHFEYLTTSIGRKQYFVKMSKVLDVKYEKNIDVYSIIKERESEAIRNAKKLITLHERNGIRSPAARVPSTRVYELVERLRSLKK